jgi:hypothetical protein
MSSHRPVKQAIATKSTCRRPMKKSTMERQQMRVMCGLRRDLTRDLRIARTVTRLPITVMIARIKVAAPSRGFVIGLTGTEVVLLFIVCWD